jgi:(2Fe-2S) ferredoxin
LHAAGIVGGPLRRAARFRLHLTGILPTGKPAGRPHDEPPRMTYYAKHVFFCLNQRDDGRACCAAHGAAELQSYAKDRIKQLKLAGPGQMRINKAGCLDRCEQGPCMVVYPEGVWYTYVDREDIDEIIERHLQGGEVVERLKI